MNGLTTNYTLDLNPSTSLRAGSGLTQVLSDGTNTYVYGLGRIAQMNTATEYFLGDALGSVRQLTNASGQVTLAKAYTPYGETRSSVGSGTSIYSYTGEQQDASGLTYLRARYYSGSTGRFLTRDTWMGDASYPMSFNGWNYVQSNPVLYIDPSGHIKETEARYAYDAMEFLRDVYDVHIMIDWGYYENGEFRGLLPISPELISQLGWDCTWVEGEWTIDELDTVIFGVDALAAAMGGPNKFKKNLGGVYVWQNETEAGGRGSAHLIRLSVNRFTQWTVVHELAHAWDGYHNWRYTAELLDRTGGYIDLKKSQKMIAGGQCDLYNDGGTYEYRDSIGKRGRLPGCNKAGYFYKNTPSGSDWKFTPREDFAESVVMYVGWIFPPKNILYVKAHDRIRRYELANGAIDAFGQKDNWANYAQYFYPDGGDYSKTLRFQFVNDLMHGRIGIP